MTRETQPDHVPFADHVALLDRLIDRHREVVERIEGSLLNVQGKPTRTRRDRPYFEQTLDACFFGLTGLPAGSAALVKQLLELHRLEGLLPERRDRFTTDLDALELVIRAYDHWDRTRWPGRSGRLAYAQCTFAVFLLRHLERLSLRVWDDGETPVRERLLDLQRLLDRLNGTTVPLAFVRDARWLIATAQSPLTSEIAPYFRIAACVADSLPPADQLEVHVASVKMTSGHLRSQLRYAVARSGKAAHDAEVLAFTRNSNALDLALIVQDLVPLLEAYGDAIGTGDAAMRVRLADSILQGLSADPDLLLVRPDLIAPYTTIEELFVEADAAGEWRWTQMGRRHLHLVDRYTTLMPRVAASLADDAGALDPARTAYSPFGIVYGFSVDILSNIAMARLVGQPSFGLAFEDTFASGGAEDAKAARAEAWKSLPTRPGEAPHFEHALDFAGVVYERLTDALGRRTARLDSANASGLSDARLVVVADGDDEAVAALPPDVARAQELCFTSDVARAAAVGGVPWPKQELLRERKEGGFLASAVVGGHVFGVSKMLLTSFIAAGRDVALTGVPPTVARKLALTASPNRQNSASAR